MGVVSLPLRLRCGHHAFFAACSPPALGGAAEQKTQAFFEAFCVARYRVP